jgi:O-antigen/teichoic acid export membrane protein
MVSCGPAVAGRRSISSYWRLARKAINRLGWGVADQAMSSISNFAINIYIARTLGPVQYGAFSLAYVTYGFALNASRGLATDPLLVRFSGTNIPTWRRAVSSCTGTAAVVGLVTGAGVIAAAALLDGTARLAFLALGLTLPGLLLQDSWRFAFFALGRGSQAFLNDAVWVLALAPALLILQTTHHTDVFWFVFAWGAAAAVGAAIGPWQARVMPRLPHTDRWVSRHRDLGPRFLLEGIIGSGSTQARNYGVGLFLGLASVGYVQAANTLMGPFMVVFFGMGLVTLPEAARLLRRSARRMILFCAAVGGGMAVLGLAWGIILLVALPRGLGHLILGQLWRPTYPLVLPSTLTILGGCASAGAGTGLHALGAAKRSLRAMIVSSVIYVIGSVAGTLTGGAVGTMRGAAIAAWIGAMAFWWELRGAMREHQKAAAGKPSEPSSASGRPSEPSAAHSS